MKRRYYYHLTSRDLGNEVVLIPSPTGENRADDEPEISRICVGPSIPHCMVSIYLADTMYVYRTKNRICSSKSWGINDAHITKERWVKRPTKFIKIRELKSIGRYSMKTGKYGFLGDGEEPSERWQKQQLKTLKKSLNEISQMD